MFIHMSEHENRDAKTPNRYTPDPRKFEDKQWLYEQYWGKVLSIDEVAAKTDVSSQTIIRAMDERGIPRRPSAYVDFDDPHDVALHYDRSYTEKTETSPATSPLIADGGRAVSWSDVS